MNSPSDPTDSGRRIFPTAEPPAARKGIEIILLAVVYIATARLGPVLAIPPGNITAVWIPSGIILAAVLIRGYWIWPGIFLGAFAGNAWAYFSAASLSAALRSLFAGAAGGAGDSLSAVVAAHLLLKARGGRDPFDRAVDVVRFVVFGAVLGPAISAWCGVTALCAAGSAPWADYLVSFATWWAGRGVGVLILTPMLLAWRARWRGGRLGRELLAFALLLPAVSFGAWALYPNVPRTTVLPLLMWAVFRFDRRVSFTAIFAVASFVIAITALDRGPFSEGDLNTRMVSLQSFLVLVTLPMFVLYAALAENRRAHERLHELNRDLDRRVHERTHRLEVMLADLEKTRRHLEEAQTIAHLGSWEWDVAEDAVSGTAELCRLFGVEAEQIASYAAFEGLLHPDDRDRVRHEVAEALKDQRLYDTEYRVVLPDGQCRHIHARGKAVFDEHGNPVHMAGICLDITEPKRMEEALRESHARLKKVLDVETVGVMFWDLASGCLMDANDAFLSIMGYSRREMEARELTWQRLTPPEYMEVSRAEVEKFLASGRVGPYEKEYLRKDGTRQWFVFAGSSLGDNVCVEFCVDISDRKKAEAELRTAHARLRKFVDANIVGVVIANAAGAVIEANDYYVNLIGFTREEFNQGKVDWRAITPPEWLPADEKATSELRERGACTPYEKEYVRRDGRRVPVLLADALLPGPDEQIAAFAIDLTARKQVENELRASQEKLRLAQRVAGVGTFDWNIQTNVNVWSPEIEALYGLPPGGFKGSYEAWRACVHPDDLPEAERRVQRSLETGSFEAEWRAVWADGTVRWLLGRAIVAKDDSGKPLRMIGVNFDITERKRAEEEIRRLNASLETRVRERTAELEAVNRELESFSYSVSHDLKAPLRSVDGFARMLDEDYADRLDDEGRRLLGVVRESARDMGHLINDLLAFSRMSRKDLHVARLDMRSLVEDARRRVMDDAGDRTIRWDIGELPSVSGDEATLREVWINLLANAVKFTRPREDAVIEVGCRWSQAENPIPNTQHPTPVFFVRDNGVGFDMAYRDKLFCVFQRLHGTDEFEGTGIGLALVQRIVQRHGGRVGAEGKVGQGATFWFTIPRDEKKTRN